MQDLSWPDGHGCRLMMVDVPKLVLQRGSFSKHLPAHTLICLPQPFRADEERRGGHIFQIIPFVSVPDDVQLYPFRLFEKTSQISKLGQSNENVDIVWWFIFSN